MAAVIIGKGLLEMVPVISVITTSIRSIGGLIDSISTRSSIKTNYTDSEISDVIDALDIKNKLETYSLLINEFPGTKSQSVRNSLVSVKNVIIEIESQLKTIKNKIDYNKRLWILATIRSYSVSKDLKFLEKLVKKLDSRIESLKTVTEISKLWNSRLFVSVENKQLSTTYDKRHVNPENDHVNNNKIPEGNIKNNDSKILDLTSYIIIDKEYIYK